MNRQPTSRDGVAATRTPWSCLLLLLMAIMVAAPTHAKKFESLARTPPMGWNSWNHFGCEVSETLIKEMADAMVSSGMRDAGYVYLNIDDCWQGPRDEQGRITADAERFPSGMKALGDYIHSKGLKFGIYSDAGWKTCAGYPGSRGYEFNDAKTYASWGVDYLKYDWCNTEGLAAEGAYLTMREALHEAARPIVFSICEWGDNQPWEWAQEIGHLWRTTGDIYNCWNCEHNHGTWSSWGVLRILDMQAGLREHAGPGKWNDPDMMEVGNGMSEAEDRSHFSMWAMLAAPLIAGNDLRKMSAATKQILTNKAVIAVDQDSLGIQGFKHKTVGKDLEVWFKPLENGEWAMTVLNRGENPQRLRWDWRSNNVDDDLSKRKIDFVKESFNWQNLWTGATGTTKELLQITVPPHDVFMVRLIKDEKKVAEMKADEKSET